MKLSRPIPEGFVLKQARVIRKASGYFINLCFQADVNIPNPFPHGNPLGIDIGLDYFAATSNHELIKRPNLDASFGQFFEILSHVCWKRDVYFAKVDKNYTSQICPNCGVHTGKKKLSERTHTCPECNFSCNRDFAASLVIRNRGLNAVGHTVLENACGDGLTGFDSNIKLVKNL